MLKTLILTFAEVDGRQTRILCWANTDVGINVPFNNQIGDLAVDIDQMEIGLIPHCHTMHPCLTQRLNLRQFLDRLDTILGLIDIESLPVIWLLHYPL